MPTGDPGVHCLTLARGGSQRLPGKNLRMVGGKPLIAWTIDAAIDAYGQCWLSTEDDNIARVARRIGASVLERPAALAQNDTPASDVLYHIITETQLANVPDNDVIVFLNATSPLRLPTDITQAVDVFYAGSYDSLLSVYCFSGFLWTLKAGQFAPTNYNPRYRPRTQDQPPTWHENGSIYITTAGTLRREKGQFVVGYVGVYKMPQSRSFEIDTPDDLEICDAMLRYRWGYDYDTD